MVLVRKSERPRRLAANSDRRRPEMTFRPGCVSFVIAIVICPTFQTVGSAQTSDTPDWTPPRTIDGQPDLQGLWTMATYTPLERPERFVNQEFLTDEEAAEIRSLVTQEGTDPIGRNIFSEEDPEKRALNTIQTKENIHYSYDSALFSPKKILFTLRFSYWKKSDFYSCRSSNIL